MLGSPALDHSGDVGRRIEQLVPGQVRRVLGAPDHSGFGETARSLVHAGGQRLAERDRGSLGTRPCGRMAAARHAGRARGRVAHGERCPRGQDRDQGVPSIEPAAVQEGADGDRRPKPCELVADGAQGRIELRVRLLRHSGGSLEHARAPGAERPDLARVGGREDAASRGRGAPGRGRDVLVDVEAMAEDPGAGGAEAETLLRGNPERVEGSGRRGPQEVSAQVQGERAQRPRGRGRGRVGRMGERHGRVELTGHSRVRRPARRPVVGDHVAGLLLREAELPRQLDPPLGDHAEPGDGATQVEDALGRRPRALEAPLVAKPVGCHPRQVGDPRGLTGRDVGEVVLPHELDGPENLRLGELDVALAEDTGDLGQREEVGRRDVDGAGRSLLAGEREEAADVVLVDQLIADVDALDPGDRGGGEDVDEQVVDVAPDRDRGPRHHRLHPALGDQRLGRLLVGAVDVVGRRALLVLLGEQRRVVRIGAVAHRRRGEDEPARPGLRHRVEHVLGAAEVDPRRLLLGLQRRDDEGEMGDHVAAIHRPEHVLGLGDVALGEVDARRKRLRRLARHAHNLVAAAVEPFDDAPSVNAGAAGDQDLHPLPFRSRTSIRPLSPSRRTRSPLRSLRVPSTVQVTQGNPSSRATIAPWLIWPPMSTAIPPAR